VWARWRRTPPETATALARQHVLLHGRTHLLLTRAVRQFRHALVPHREDGCFAAGITVSVNTISESAMSKPVPEPLLAALAGSGTEFSSHRSTALVCRDIKPKDPVPENSLVSTTQPDKEEDMRGQDGQQLGVADDTISQFLGATLADSELVSAAAFR
jgi:hypothetical protein